MKETLLQLVKLSTGYGRKSSQKVVSKNLNARILRGELVALIGANGAGKSTLLRTLCGFQSPIEGDVYIKGQSLTAYSPLELARLLSIVLTEKPDTGWLTVIETVSLGRIPHKDDRWSTSSKAKDIIEHSLKQTHTTQFKYRRLTSLSDGERQRVMIAKSLVQETPLILLDEPTAFLDFPSKLQIMKLLRQLAYEEQKSILIATHDLEMILRYADRLWIITDQGIKEGTPSVLAQSGTLDRLFKQDGISFDVQTFRFNLHQ